MWWWTKHGLRVLRGGWKGGPDRERVGYQGAQHAGEAGSPDQEPAPAP
jgi:hypothetical protein